MMLWIPTDWLPTQGRTPKSLLDLMPDPATDSGVFAYLDSFDFISPLENNLEYLYNHSGDKLPSSLVSALAVDDELSAASLQSLATIISTRFGHKWNKLWEDLSAETSPFQTVDLTEATQYGKKNVRTGKEVFSKSGTETHTKDGSETSTESFPETRSTERKIEGGWKDTDDRAYTRTGTETSSESFPTARKSAKSISGGYADTDTTATTRTGSQKVTDKGDTLATGYGFNSSTGTPVSKTGPADDTNGITSETTYGQEGLKDTKSGAITRSYDQYKEETTESGERKVETSYGQAGIKDATDGKVSRLYENYKDTVTESGKRKVEKEYTDYTDELSFDERQDTKEYQSVQNAQSGTDTTRRTGYEIRRLADKTEMLKILYTEPSFYDLMRVVYADIDEVLTMQIFV